MNKLSTFSYAGTVHQVQFLKSYPVDEGVLCYSYAFSDDDSRDLAIITVSSGFATPLQKVLKGDKTIEGHLEGKGTLDLTLEDGSSKKYIFPGTQDNEIIVKIGQTMQWKAIDDLIIYEICEPPYEEGRFENIGS